MKRHNTAKTIERRSMSVTLTDMVMSRGRNLWTEGEDVTLLPGSSVTYRALKREHHGAGYDK